MLQHHEETIARLQAQCAQEPGVLALLITGSVARGEARADSDVDCVIVMNPTAWQAAAQRGALTRYQPELASYAGGYVDAKCMTLAFLEDLAARGNEVARSAFEGAKIRFSALPDLAPVLARIVEYPEAGRLERMASFLAQMLSAQWYLGEAERRADPYLKLRFSSEIVLWATRLILAHNRILYPYHKWMRQRLQRAAEQPPTLTAHIDALLAAPGKPAADALVDCMLSWRQWPDGGKPWPEHFMHDIEWAWRRGTTPLSDL